MTEPAIFRPTSKCRACGAPALVLPDFCSKCVHVFEKLADFGIEIPEPMLRGVVRDNLLPSSGRGTHGPAAQAVSYDELTEDDLYALGICTDDPPSSHPTGSLDGTPEPPTR